MKSIMALSVLLLIVARAKAAQENVDGVTYTYDVRYGGEAIIANNGNYAAASSHKAARGSLKIPSTLGGYPVTGIDAYAFFECKGLTDVVIPNSVTYIGKKAFFNTGLTRVVISPAKGLKVCEEAFDTCPYSDNELIAVGTTDLAAWCGIDFESESANPLFYTQKFYAPDLVKNLVVPDGVEEIKPYAFVDYTNLTSVTIPSSVKSIGERAFYYCRGLKNVAIPNSVTNIGERAFYRSGLTSITIPNSVTSIKDGVFEDCRCLGSVVIPNSVTNIGKESFDHCWGLSIHISDLVAWCRVESHSSLEYGKLFLNGKCVEDLIIPDSVTSIKPGPFRGFSCLKSVTIPNSVTNIHSSAFAGCSDLKSVHISDLAVWCKSGGGRGFNRRYSDGGYNLYLNGELVTDLIIPESVTDIGNSAFAHCRSLTSVTIPNSVTNIEAFAFAGCGDLKWCVVPSSVKSIGSYAFYHSRLLSAVYYLGNAPSTSSRGIYEDTPTNLISYVTEGSTGWLMPNFPALPETWPLNDTHPRAIKHGVPGSAKGVSNGKR